MKLTRVGRGKQVYSDRTRRKTGARVLGTEWGGSRANSVHCPYMGSLKEIEEFLKFCYLDDAYLLGTIFFYLKPV
jgi:hypothetical protein